MNDDTARALADLTELTGFGPRFHGEQGIHDAADWLESRLTAVGLEVRREPVSLPAWRPGAEDTLLVTTPIERSMPVWPMLWSGSSDGVVSGRLRPLGPQGIWGDSITWQRFLVEGSDGAVLAYVHARDVGPAAPQPLPHGSDTTVPHLVVGRLDGLQLREWAVTGKEVTVSLRADSSALDTVAVADNLIVDVPGTPAPEARDAGGTVLVCAHYDTFYNTVGAYDNGSGTIALLALAERWAVTPPGRPVRLVWFTAEEWHLGGSRHHVDSAAEEELAAIDHVVNVDGLGRGSFLETFASPEEFGVEVDRTVSAYAAETCRVLETANRFPPTTGTDDASFHRAGVPSVFLTFNDLHRLHQPDDLPSAGIAENVVWALGLVERFVELSAPRRPGTPGIL